MYLPGGRYSYLSQSHITLHYWNHRYEIILSITHFPASNLPLLFFFHAGGGRIHTSDVWLQMNKTIFKPTSCSFFHCYVLFKTIPAQLQQKLKSVGKGPGAQTTMLFLVSKKSKKGQSIKCFWVFWRPVPPGSPQLSSLNNIIILVFFQIQSFVDSLPKTDAYIVEMQSHRVGKHAVALLPFVLHLRIMEAMIHCLLPPPVIPLDPHYTSKYFGLPSGHAQKKKAAVSLVQSLFLERQELAIEEECESYLKEKSGLEGSEAIVEGLVGNPVSSEEGDRQTSQGAELVVPNSTCPNLKLQISAELIEYFQSCKKKDDLSDCLLQALAFFNLLSESEN